MNILVIFCFFIFGASAQLSFPSTSGPEIAASHNKMRSLFAKGAYYIRGQLKPTAKNMLKMFWDSNLATSAQNYADTCPTGPSGAVGYGENIYFWYTTSPTSYLDGYVLNTPRKWEEEFEEVGLSSLTMDATLLASGVADATQMIWAKTKYVGCGVKNCGPDPSQSNKTRIAVVCHYSPKGNIIGEVIYEQGLTCSSCPSPAVCESNMGFSTGLCV